MNQGRTRMELALDGTIVFNNLDFGMPDAKKTSVDMTKRLTERRVDHRFTNPSFPPQFDPPTGPPIRPAQPVLRASSDHAFKINSKIFPSGFSLIDR